MADQRKITRADADYARANADLAKAALPTQIVHYLGLALLFGVAGVILIFAIRMFGEEIIQPLAGKETLANIHVNVALSIALGFSVALNLTMGGLWLVRRRSTQRVRKRSDTHEPLIMELKDQIAELEAKVSKSA